MSHITLASLFVVEAYTTILNKGLDLAASVGLPVTSWRAGDPTKSSYEYLATILAQLELVLQEHIKGGFLAFAEDDWLDLHGEQVYGVEREQATYATSEVGEGVTLVNAGGAVHTIEVGDLTFKASSINKTYHNTTGGVLESGPGTTITLEFIADEEGSASSVTADEIDTLVTTLLGVSVLSSSAAFAVDKQGNKEFQDLCLASLGALSPNGPADAYRYVALKSELTGVTDVTKAWATSDAPTGEVTLYLAGPSGAVAGGSVTAVADAIAVWAAPLCITPQVESADSVNVDVEVTIYLRGTFGIDAPTAEGLAEDSITEVFPVAGEDEFLFTSQINAACFDAFTQGAVKNVVITQPAADVALAINEVASLGTLSITVEIV